MAKKRYKINKIDFFKFGDALFTDAETWKEINPKEKSKHFFQTQRTIAKMYPIRVNQFNKDGIDSVSIMEMYHNAFCGKDTRWRFTKSTLTKKTISDEDALMIKECNKYSKKLKNLLMKKYDLEYKHLNELINKDPSFILSEYDILKIETGIKK